MRNWLEKACEESNLTLEECAALLGQPAEVFALKVQNPGSLTLNELLALRLTFNEAARATLWEALGELQP